MLMTRDSVLGHEHQLSDETAFGRAVAVALLARHPVHTAGHVAQRLRCTKKAAENVLDGHLSARTITRLVLAYGWDLIAEATAAVTGQTLEQFIIESAEEARKERAAATERWRRQAALVGELRGLHPIPTGDHRPVS